MSVKHFGIYLAYPPMVDLKKEGLGRYLAMFLKGAEALDGVHFTIVCPSWSQKSLSELFESERVSAHLFRIETPHGEPYALKVLERMQRRRRTRRRSKVALLIRKVKGVASNFWSALAAQAVQVHSGPAFLGFVLSTTVKFLLLAVLGLLLLPLALLAFAVIWTSDRLRRTRPFKRVMDILAPKADNALALNLFDEMHRSEMARMHALIVDMHDVRAWYCPVAFWPAFHDIDKPRLICIPDVWPTDFPMGFAGDGDRLRVVVDRIGDSIHRATHLVTYSLQIKWDTLVQHYGLNPERISVIHHAPNRMDEFNAVSGTGQQLYCQQLLLSAIRRGANPQYSEGFQNKEVAYIFYASQFRPNKNVLTLLRAYKDLLRHRHFPHKLILTGNAEAREIRQFVLQNRLENDVLFLHGLTTSELAACYQLADLAVNPSFAEGGCPFTFTEALSVGTPVVMARIPVTEEILTDDLLQQMTLFDPYDWLDCADRMAWALQNQDELLRAQKATFDVLAQRTWTDVVTEHVTILDRISLYA